MTSTVPAEIIIVDEFCQKLLILKTGQVSSNIIICHNSLEGRGDTGGVNRCVSRLRNPALILAGPDLWNCPQAEWKSRLDMISDSGWPMILETSLERDLYCENVEMVDKKNYNKVFRACTKYGIIDRITVTG